MRKSNIILSLIAVSVCLFFLGHSIRLHTTQGFGTNDTTFKSIKAHHTSVQFPFHYEMTDSKNNTQEHLSIHEYHKYINTKDQKKDSILVTIVLKQEIHKYHKGKGDYDFYTSIYATNDRGQSTKKLYDHYTFCKKATDTTKILETERIKAMPSYYKLLKTYKNVWFN